jgi:purine-nucleoside phosphorylase
MGTTHNSACKGDIAPAVLLPGDPLRAKYIAGNFLENAVCYNEIRGMLGFTGTYRGKRVSVQGTGMGSPSISIYANELMEHYEAETLIRVGTCGSIREDVHIKDIVIAVGASTDSGMNHDRFGNICFAPTASFELLLKAWEEAKAAGIKAVAADVFTSDKFYDDRLVSKRELMTAYGVAAMDMETCELYTLAARHGRKALSLLTVSDHLITGEKCSTEERQTSFNSMIELALEIL